MIDYEKLAKTQSAINANEKPYIHSYSCSIGLQAYFGVVETLNKHSTKLGLMEKDLEANSEFRIKYQILDRSIFDEYGFMLVEHMGFN